MHKLPLFAPPAMGLPKGSPCSQPSTQHLTSLVQHPGSDRLEEASVLMDLGLHTGSLVQHGAEVFGVGEVG